MKFYAVQFRYVDSDTDDPFTEWFTTKTEAIARAKHLSTQDDIYCYCAHRAEVPTTKKALLKWLNACKGVVFVPGFQEVWRAPSIWMGGE
jgi:hypothetical protein